MRLLSTAVDLLTEFVADPNGHASPEYIDRVNQFLDHAEMRSKHREANREKRRARRNLAGQAQ